jgi:SAM-dependent methyltransferase
VKPFVISLLKHFPNLKRMLHGLRNQLFPGSVVSLNYEPLKSDEANLVSQRLRAAWQDDSIPQKQLELAGQQLRQYRAGERINVFDVFANSLRALPDLTPGMSLLEIGCSSGYYSEVIEIAGIPLNYTGCDYSAAFIRLAREKYPSVNFSVEEATDLHYPDCSFDIVVSGCCILHIPEYENAIKETARVSSRYAIFHRTPVVWGRPEQWYRKQAYGIETIEIHFSEPELLAMLDKNGLELIATYTLHEESLSANRTQGYAIRTYVCRKKVQ